MSAVNENATIQGRRISKIDGAAYQTIAPTLLLAVLGIAQCCSLHAVSTGAFVLLSGWVARNISIVADFTCRSLGDPVVQKKIPRACFAPGQIQYNYCSGGAHCIALTCEPPSCFTMIYTSTEHVVRKICKQRKRLIVESWHIVCVRAVGYPSSASERHDRKRACP